MNKKGFTLTELLVVVVILGIISGLSIPLIRNLTTVFEKKKYESYADSVLASAKLFNDSYSEDLFGHSDYGCAYITYEKMQEKGLLKDIEVEDVSCNSDKTYVRVIKQKDKYGYAVYLSCGKKVNGEIESIDISIPKDVPEMNSNACGGPERNIDISIINAQTGGSADKNRKKAKLQIESGTGLNNNMLIYAKWSTNSTDYSNTGFEKVNFKVKGNQEASLLNGQSIITTSNELVSPKDTGTFYLIVRVDRLEDLYGNKWKNKENPDSKYLTYGPFLIDSIPPSITANVYKCDSSYNKTGDIIISKTNSGEETTFDLKDMSLAVNEWATFKNFANGVCFEFEISDNVGLKTSTWEWNSMSQRAPAKKEFDESRRSTKNYSGETSAVVYKSITGEGERYARISAKDPAGNKTSIMIRVGYDITPPTGLSISNPYENKWTRNDVVLTLSATDAINDIGDYYYTYKENATIETEHVPANQSGYSGEKWIQLTGGTGKTSFTTEAWGPNVPEGQSFNRTTYISVSDSVVNYSEKKSTIIKIDKVKPSKPTIVNSSNHTTRGTWTNQNVTLDISSTDAHAGIKDYYYSYKENASGYSDNINDDASNKWVKLDGGTGQESFTTTPWVKWNNNVREYTVYVKSKDNVGNYSDVEYTNIKIDTIKPTKPTIVNSSNHTTRGTWTNQPVTLTLSSTDANSGIEGYYYSYNSNPSGYSGNDADADKKWVKFKGYTGQTSFTTEQWNVWDNKVREYTVYVKSMDNAGNSSDIEYTYVKIDAIKPTMPSIVNSSNNTTRGDWTNQNVTLTLASTDANSGMAHYYYTYNANATEYGGNNSVSETKWAPLTNGYGTEQFTTEEWPVNDNSYMNRTVYIQSCDKAGNCSDVNYTNIQIDKIDPSCGSINKTRTYSRYGVNGTIACNDNNSGCEYNSYSYNSLTSSTNITIEDKAGNTNTCRIPVYSEERTAYHESIATASYTQTVLVYAMNGDSSTNITYSAYWASKMHPEKLCKDYSCSYKSETITQCSNLTSSNKYYTWMPYTWNPSAACNTVEYQYNSDSGCRDLTYYDDTSVEGGEGHIYHSCSEVAVGYPYRACEKYWDLGSSCPTYGTSSSDGATGCNSLLPWVYSNTNYGSCWYNCSSKCGLRTEAPYSYEVEYDYVKRDPYTYDVYY